MSLFYCRSRLTAVRTCGLLCSVTLLVLVSCSPGGEPQVNTLKSFSSDGCSLFPDSSVITSHDWCDCCFQHDIAYWRGGTAEQREDADQVLRRCVNDKTGNKALATLMFEGVRVGGSPYFHTWYRWGYGWTMDRHYEPLDSAEIELADQMMMEYRNSESVSVCKLGDESKVKKPQR